MRLIKYITCTGCIFLHHGTAYLLTRTTLGNSVQADDRWINGWSIFTERLTNKRLQSAALPENLHAAYMLGQIKNIRNSRTAATKKTRSQLFFITRWNHSISQPTGLQQDTYFSTYYHTTDNTNCVLLPALISFKPKQLHQLYRK